MARAALSERLKHCGLAHARGRVRTLKQRIENGEPYMSEIVKRPPGFAPLSPELEAATADMAGFGLSNQATDYKTPQMKVMQSGSPELDSIAGCQVGDIVITDTPHPPFAGETGVLVQHCGQIDTVTEWLPARQGFVSQPGTNGSRRPVLTARGSGNLLVPTKELYLIAAGTCCVLYASGTQHQFARKLMTYMAQQKRSDGKVAASFSRLYRFYTAHDHNQLGSWWGLRFEDAGPAPVDRIAPALEFYKFAMSGALRLSAPEAA
jgi:hypothetical protein